MNRLNKMCDIEEKWMMACIYAGHCLPVHYTVFHDVRDAIRYNSKTSAFHNRVNKLSEDIRNDLVKRIPDLFPQITD